MQALCSEAAASPCGRLVRPNSFTSRLFPGRRCSSRGLFRDCLTAPLPRRQGRSGPLPSTQASSTTLASSRGGPRRGATTTAPNEQRTRSSVTPSGTGGDNDPDDEPGSSSSSSGNSYQIGLDPFSQQLIMSAVTVGSACALATWAHLDLSSAFRLEADALSLALQLSAPVLLLLLAVVAPWWAPPYKGSELERLRHNYYMTAQVLQLYLDLDEDKEEEEEGASSGANGGGGGLSGERARVRRRLRLEQTVGWGTITSGLALMQAFTLQPWNPPTANSVFGLGLAGRSAQQLANEFLVRGAGWGLLSGWVITELQAADASDGILFFGKVFGGLDTVKYAAGLALVALALPGALWEARAARNFVRASVVGPVRDAAIFCTGNGVDEPAYCDPMGFAMMAARRPANAAPVADVVTRTRGWRSGPAATYSSVSSMGSMDVADLSPEVDKELEQAVRQQQQQAAAGMASSSASSLFSRPSPSHDSSVASASAFRNTSESSGSSGNANPNGHSDANGNGNGSMSGVTHPPPAAAASSTPFPTPAAPPPVSETSSLSPPTAAAATSTATSGRSETNLGPGLGSGPRDTAPPRPATAAASSSSSSLTPSAAAASSPPPPPPPPRVGPTLSASSAAFEWDSEDMSVLLRVETLQDKIALWSSLYYQLLVAFAINGAFLASDCNLLASFATAWLLRTGPLLLAELRARAAANAAMRAG